MIAIIRRALDAARLARELERAEAEIKSLKAELSGRLLRPSFREVAKYFDASELFPMVADRVVEDLAPFLEREAVMLLKTAFKGLERDRSGGPMMSMSVAEDLNNMVYVARFETERMGTTVNVARVK